MTTFVLVCIVDGCDLVYEFTPYTKILFPFEIEATTTLELLSK
jgi:hypothetical protein